MKTALFMFLFALSVPLIAQTDSTASPAKSSITGFWKQINKLKAMEASSGQFESSLQMAATYLNNVKKQDPAWNVSKMDEAYATQNARLKVANNKVAADKQARSDKSQLAGEIEDSLFRGIPYNGNQWHSDADSRDNKARRDQHYKNVAHFASMNPDTNDSQLKMTRQVLVRETSAASKELKDNANCIRTWGDSSAMGCYERLLALEAYWYGATTIFPGNATFRQTHAQIRDTVKAFGGTANVWAIISKNYKNRGSKVFMPAAVKTDPALEADFKRVFESQGWNETVLKINLLTSDWTIVRNPATGIITGREQAAAIAAKNKNGDCLLYTFVIVQEYDGSRYLTSKRSSHNTEWISCENVK
jgi:hypothetical protein